MSLEELGNKIMSWIEDKDFEFKETLKLDTICKFAAKMPKDWTKDNVMEYIDKRYKDLKLYCLSHCKQDELYTKEYFPTIEEYLKKFNKD